MPIQINVTKVSKSFLHHNGTVTEGGIEENLGHNVGGVRLPNSIPATTEGTTEEIKK